MVNSAPDQFGCILTISSGQGPVCAASARRVSLHGHVLRRRGYTALFVRTSSILRHCPSDILSFLNFVTRTDSEVTNSEIFRSAISAGISTYSYHPKGDRTLPNTASVWGTEVGYDTITIVVKEFWPAFAANCKKSSRSQCSFGELSVPVVDSENKRICHRLGPTLGVPASLRYDNKNSANAAPLVSGRSGQRMRIRGHCQATFHVRRGSDQTRSVLKSR